LFNYAMPLVRYAVGDVGVPSEKVCTCGRTLPLMDIVEGRKDSFLFLPNGQIVSPRSFTIAISTFQLYEQIDQFRVVQKETDLFEVQIQKKQPFSEDELMATLLSEHLRKTFRLSKKEVTFDINFVDRIPLDKNGKLMMVVSEIEKPFIREN
jgi:phenylacetate-CoA ligase